MMHPCRVREETRGQACFCLVGSGNEAGGKVQMAVHTDGGPEHDLVMVACWEDEDLAAIVGKVAGPCGTIVSILV